MNISGSNSIIKRNIYPQTGNCSFVFTGNVVNTTGQFKIGFSGDAGDYYVILESGKILDKNYDFLGSYNSYVDFGLKYEISSGTYNIFINNTPVKLASSKNTGIIDYFYVWRNDESEITFDTSIFGGSKPSLTIAEVGYLLNTGQDVVSGLFSNRSSFPIKLFDMESNSVALTLVKPTGQIYSGSYFLYSGDFANINLEYPIETIFYTNYQNYEINFRIIDLRQSQLYILLNESQINSGMNINNYILNNIYYNNYSGAELFDFESDFTVSLNHISGSGIKIDSTYDYQIMYSTITSGEIVNSGLLNWTYLRASGDVFRTGNIIATGNALHYATGVFEGNYSIIASGYGTGDGYSGMSQTFLSDSIFFTILDGSGIYKFTNKQIESITVEPGLSIYYPDYIRATGSIDLSEAGNTDVIYIGDPSNPIVKSFHYFTPSGLASYLSWNDNHKVTATFSGSMIYLTYYAPDQNGNGWLLSGNPCNVGNIKFSDRYLTGGENIGSTGLAIIPVGIQTGFLNTIYTGSGTYINIETGYSNFIFQYIKEFTKSWNLLTGDSRFDLVKIPELYTDTISTTSVLKPNSLLTIRVDHTLDSINKDFSQLIISGSKIRNPITINLKS